MSATMVETKRRRGPRKQVSPVVGSALVESKKGSEKGIEGGKIKAKVARGTTKMQGYGFAQISVVDAVGRELEPPSWKGGENEADYRSKVLNFGSHE